MSLVGLLFFMGTPSQAQSLPSDQDPIGDLIRKVSQPKQDEIGDLIRKLDQPQKPQVHYVNTPKPARKVKPKFFWRTKGIVLVYQDKDKKHLAYAVGPNELIPFGGLSHSMALIKNQTTGEQLYADVHGKVEEVDASKRPIRVYLDAPEGQIFTITSQPGKTFRDCGDKVNEADKPCIAWPAAGHADIEILDSELVEGEDPWQDPDHPELKRELFYKVHVRYWRQHVLVDRVGWIAAKNIRPDKLPKSSLPISEVNEAPVPRPKPRPKCPNYHKGLKDQLQELKQRSSEVAPPSRSLLSAVGACYRHGHLAKHNKNPLRNILRPQLISDIREEKRPARYRGRTVSHSDLLAIDVLARTLYGEMRGCFDKGVRYPAAVARVIINRAELIKAKGKVIPLVKESNAMVKRQNHGRGYQQLSVSEIIPYVVSSSDQFSSWNPEDPNMPLLMCPNKRSPQDKAIWNKSVEIAAQAVLDRARFKRETRSVNAIYFSSGLKPWWVNKADMTELRHIKVGGLPLDSPSCLRLWASR